MQRSFVLSVVIITTVALLPGHAAARCFGTVEPGARPEIGAGWYVNLTIIASNGTDDTARFGAAEGASDFFDRDVDIRENETGEEGILLFFRVIEASFLHAFWARADTAVNDVSLPESLWRLTIVYHGAVAQDFRLEWDLAEVAAVPATWTLWIEPPGRGSVDMRTLDAVTVGIEPGEHPSPIVGTHADEDPGPAGQTLASAGALYVALVVFVLLLRRHRKGRQASPSAIPRQGISGGTQAARRPGASGVDPRPRKRG